MKIKMENKWGRNQLMVTAAFRYCLSRKTYIVADCVKWIIDNWNEFDGRTKKIIELDIERELIKYETLEKEGKPLSYASLDCNRSRERWERVRKLYKIEKKE